jgi:hypothetical protein
MNNGKTIVYGMKNGKLVEISRYETYKRALMDVRYNMEKKDSPYKGFSAITLAPVASWNC